ncbi:MAG: TAT-variant-translocated molybdopterin oxidoreductase [Ignavibacteriae bacterium]|nr:TAT-variant-translocated molybdopterin oxidoreductase [Ignavibacteriota bacterium]
MNDTRDTGKTYWKSFQELARDPAVMEQLHNEFPADYDAPLGSASAMTRRTFIGLMGASVALAATGCRKPEQEIVPYVRKPESLVPGVSQHYATVFALGYAAQPLLVRSREGRPIKVEGNDRDTTTGGASSHFAQASLLALYDPDRILRPTVQNSDSTPHNAVTRIAAAFADTAKKGKAVRILVDEHASPSMARLYEALERAIPNCKVVTWPAMSAWNAAESNKALLGIDGLFAVDLAKADVILGIEADFLGADPDAVRNIRGFASRRKPTRAAASMSRFYAAESVMTLTGSNADHRLVLGPSEFESFLHAVLHEVAVVRRRGALDAAVLAELSRKAPASFPMIGAIADDLLRGSAVVMVGRHLSMRAQAYGVLLNLAIGAYGANRPLDPAHVYPYSGSAKTAVESLRAELRRGDVGAVLFADVNLAHALGEKEFRGLLSKVLYRFACSQYADETSKACTIFLPVNHALECWGDAELPDGTQVVQQPLIAPLNDGQWSLGDTLLRIAQLSNAAAAPVESTWYDFVRARWRRDVQTAAGASAGGFDAFWQNALREGLVSITATRRPLAINMAQALPLLRAQTSAGGSFTVCIAPSNTVYDGRFANLGWLQEMPDPVTKVTWGNAALLGPATAKALGVKKDDVIRIKTASGAVELPVLVQPGVAENTVAVSTGYGRSEGGRVLAGVGVDTAGLLPAQGPSLGFAACSVEKTGAVAPLACTQDHHSLGGDELYDIDRSDIVKEATLADFTKNPSVLFARELPVLGAEKQHDRPISLMEPHDYSKGHRWGMTIDASACVGCSACMIACVSENNIPVVGKEQVMKGREMHWLRIDRYYSGDEAAPETLVQPMLCQHCENAPCENVCPVAATTHSPEGLNEMTYNRCVGTRYCSNNCPYKVRRFNYLDYHGDDRDPLGMVFNPDVTVRMRGVMEKCTFCVQRINDAKFHAKNEGRDRLADGEVVTACQQACPADAIVFGDLNDPASAVSASRGSERGYLVLRELNVQPSITYLAKIRNTNGGKA